MPDDQGSSNRSEEDSSRSGLLSGLRNLLFGGDKEPSLREQIAVAAIGAGGDVLLLNRIREATLVHLIHLIEAASDRSPSLCLYCKIRSEEHTSELQSLMRISYAVF